MSNYYISDTHFGHSNVIDFDHRPYKNVQEMDEALINNWNNVVSNEDTVYILGDFCWLKEDEWLEYLWQLKGKKQLIRGNHDLWSMSTILKKEFADIKEYKEITDNGRHVIMCHYPLLCYKGSYDPKTWMLHGHTHITREQDFVEAWTKELIQSKALESDSWGHIINVGCMIHNYIPVTLDQLIAFYNNKYNSLLGDI